MENTVPHSIKRLPTTAQILAHPEIDWEDLIEDEDEEEEGGEEEESEEGSEEEEGGDGEEEGEEGEENEPVSRAEFAKVTEALKKANAEAKKYRLEAKRLKQAGESDDDKVKREAAEAAAAETEAKYKKALVNASAKAMLAEAGLKGKPDRFIKMLDLAEIEVDDDGDIVGLDDQIDSIKTDFPEVFDAKTRAAGKGDPAPKGGAAGKKMSSAERIAQLARR